VPKTKDDDLVIRDLVSQLVLGDQRTTNLAPPILSETPADHWMIGNIPGRAHGGLQTSGSGTFVSGRENGMQPGQVGSAPTVQRSRIPSAEAATRRYRDYAPGPSLPHGIPVTALGRPPVSTSGRLAAPHGPPSGNPDYVARDCFNWTA
jgi:hypothetical protein